MKLGFILDSEIIPPDLVALLNASRTSKSFSIDLVVCYSSDDFSNLNFVSRAWRNYLTIGIRQSLRRFLFRFVNYMESKLDASCLREAVPQSLHVRDSGISLLHITPIFSKSKFIVRFGDEELDLIRNRNLDLLIRGGRHILRDGILNVCTYGVVGIHHGDNEKFRGLPSGFWEVYYREPFTGYIFQRLRNELDDGVVFFKGQMATRSTSYENTLALHHQARQDFVEFIEKVSDSGIFPAPIERKGDLVPLLTAPTVRQLIRYIVRALFRRFW